MKSRHCMKTWWIIQCESRQDKNIEEDKNIEFLIEMVALNIFETYSKIKISEIFSGFPSLKLL